MEQNLEIDRELKYCNLALYTRYMYNNFKNCMYFFYVWAFCLHLCLSTTHTQYLRRPGKASQLVVNCSVGAEN